MNPMHSPSPPAGAESGRLSVGLRDGVRCYFDVDDITISVWGSSLTGREVIRVDDQVVSDRVSWRLRTRHEFEHAGVAYIVDVIIESIFHARYRIVLYRNGQQVDSDSAEWSAWPSSLTRSFVVGLLVGFGAALGLLLARGL